MADWTEESGAGARALAAKEALEEQSYSTRVAPAVQTVEELAAAELANKTMGTLRSETVLEVEKESDLPEGWHVAVEVDLRKKYYWNEATEHRQWQSPVQGLTEGEDPTLAAKTMEAMFQEVLPHSWRLAICKQEKLPYYWHPTQGVQWARPHAQVHLHAKPMEQLHRECISKAEKGSLPAGWHVAVDAGTHKKYYWHEGDGHVQWDDPSDTGKTADPHPELAGKSLKELHGESIEEGWHVAVCEDSKKRYYWNPETGEVRWDPPPHSIGRKREKKSTMEDYEHEHQREAKRHETYLKMKDQEVVEKEVHTRRPKGDTLPEGWHMAVDAKSHKTYYWHEGDGHVQWERPVPHPEHGEVVRQEKDPSLAKKTHREVLQERLPEGCSMAYCKEKGQHYLVHEDNSVHWKQKAPVDYAAYVKETHVNGKTLPEVPPGTPPGDDVLT